MPFVSFLRRMDAGHVQLVMTSWEWLPRFSFFLVGGLISWWPPPPCPLNLVGCASVIPLFFLLVRDVFAVRCAFMLMLAACCTAAARVEIRTTSAAVCGTYSGQAASRCGIRAASRRLYNMQPTIVSAAANKHQYKYQCMRITCVYINVKGSLEKAQKCEEITERWRRDQQYLKGSNKRKRQPEKK